MFWFLGIFVLTICLSFIWMWHDTRTNLFQKRNHRRDGPIHPSLTFKGKKRHAERQKGLRAIAEDIKDEQASIEQAPIEEVPIEEAPVEQGPIETDEHDLW